MQNTSITTEKHIHNSSRGPTELNTQHIYQLNTSDNLASGLNPLAVDHKIHDKYPKLLHIPLLNTRYDTVYIPKDVSGTLHPIGSKI